MLHNNFHAYEESPAMKVFNLVLVSINFVKILFYLRIYTEFGALVDVLIETTKAIMNFLAFFLFTNFFLTFAYTVLGNRFDEEEFLPGLSNFMLSFFMTLRISIGDI
jgi:hypothetical protein